jgi:hypothetical protein
MQYIRHYATSKSPQMPYHLVREDFEKHVTLCLRLELSRNPPPGLHCTTVPPNWVDVMQQLSLEYMPCGASLSGLKCEKVRLRHGDHHQGLAHQGSRVTRWIGEYEACEFTASQTFQESFRETLERDGMKKVSLGDLSESPLQLTKPFILITMVSPQKHFQIYDLWYHA